MIGLIQEEVKAALVTRMGNIGVILDPEQPASGVRFMGMGNKRTAAVTLPDDTDDISGAVEALAGEIEAGLKRKENSNG